MAQLKNKIFLAKSTNQKPSKYDFDFVGTKLVCDSWTLEQLEW